MAKKSRFRARIRNTVRNTNNMFSNRQCIDALTDLEETRSPNKRFNKQKQNTQMGIGYICRFRYIYTWACVEVFTQVTCLYIYIYIYVCTCAHHAICTCLCLIYEYVHKYIYIYMCIYKTKLSVYVLCAVRSQFPIAIL